MAIGIFSVLIALDTLLLAYFRSRQDKNKYLKHKQNILKRNIEYYHQNRDKIIQKQTELWKSKYAFNEQFRKKRQFRDKTIKKVKLYDKNCENCGSPEDLHRHHPNYQNFNDYIILCRGCHNNIHFK